MFYVLFPVLMIVWTLVHLHLVSLANCYELRLVRRDQCECD